MNYYLKIQNEVKGRAVMKVDGSSGLLYLFAWNSVLRAYTFHPKDQDQVDDLFRTMGRTTGYQFCPVNREIAAPAVAAPAPIAAPLSSVSKELCEFRGITCFQADTDETAGRLVSAYDRGQLEALNSMPSRLKKPKPQMEPV